jgi:predicted ribosome quality control (RQC) complex YloA/Tae2 family protein
MSKQEITLEGGTKIIQYELPDDWIAQVGKTALDNDELSIKHAGQKDWWFHVRGMPGGHVVLRARDGFEADKDTLKRAAAIAAWHSKAREAGQVPVSYTLAKNVSKPRGAKAGTVQIKKEKVLKVRPGIPD